MINLLPPQEKQILRDKEREKLASIWGIIILVALVCLLLILLSIKLYILADANYQKDLLAQFVRENQTAEFTNLNNIVKDSNKILVQLKSFYANQVYFEDVIKIIKSVSMPKGVYFTDISLARGKKGEVIASVSGVSATRDALIALKDSIEQNGKIANPLFSQDSWLDPVDVEFLLKMEVNPNGE